MFLAQISKKKIHLNTVCCIPRDEKKYFMKSGMEPKLNRTVQSKTLQNNKCLGKGSGSAFMYNT